MAMPRKWVNKLAVLLFQIPWVKNRWSHSFDVVESESVPWTPLRKPLRDCKMALITTGGVHLRTDKPFDMTDPDGDPSYREIPSTVQPDELTITHDYYNHDDADKDINLVFPIEILREAQDAGWIAESAQTFYGLMGHVDKAHVKTLMERTAKAIARQLKQEEVDAVFLVPA